MRYLLAFFASLVVSGAGLAQAYTIDGPERAHIRESLDIGWTAPQDDGGLIEIRPADGEQRRSVYAYVRANPQSILAPNAAGEYVIVYVHGGEVQASRPLSVYLPEATLAAPDTADAGAAFEVVWTGPDSNGDRITLAERDGAVIRGLSYAYTGSRNGSPVRLTAPRDAGEYDIVYVSADTVLARAPLTVGGITASLSAPAQVHAGGTVTVAWEGPRNAQDRITFAARDGEPLGGASYRYVSAATGQSVVLIAAETTGPVDIVYLSGGRVIGRTPIEVIPASIELDAPSAVEARMQFEARWSGAGNQGDVIRMQAADGSQAAYRYIDPNEPVAPLVAPASEGEYELVYFSRAGREMARRAITVRPAPQLPGELLVEQSRAQLGPQDAVGVILDASGSMLQRIGSERRIEIARQTLAHLVSDTIPAGTGFALRVFGHRETDSCRTDLEIPLGPLVPDAASAVISNVNAMNLARTPLGHSIALAGDDLGAATGQRILILLTDGEETCDGDPAAAIQSLRDRGWDIRVNIVGFAIDDADLEAEFRAWAALGNGDYFTAGDGAELEAALSQAIAVEFEIIDAATGETAGHGRAGEPVTLAPGDYQLRWGEAGTRNLAIVSAETTRVTLD
ncbi:vWA domain-containing protein [Maricaulis sp.]|uniref:vWA domain-containing protein n=1 Tax=Maricaulis sp. TaxID=1486257 RepID=UPI003A8F6491